MTNPSLDNTAFFAPVRPGVPGPGWFALLIALHRQLHSIDHAYVVNEVKELRGVLAIDCEFSTPEARQEGYKMISAAEAASAHICEECGAPGRLCLPSYKTWCPEHEKGRL
jgi:hypothetical protein